jgi:hypothetical protein
MIEYALLCQTIADWRAGRRPVLPPSSSPTLQGASSNAAPPSPSDDDAEMIEGDPEIDDALVESDSSPLDLDQGYGDAPPADAPPDYDSTMVYGSGDATPGQWSDEPGDGDHEPPR